MQILYGPHAGKTARVRQFSNGWITYELASGERTDPIAPDRVQLTSAEEMQLFERTRGTHNVGMFWQWWELDATGRFRSLRPAPTRHYRGCASRRGTRRR